MPDRPAFTAWLSRVQLEAERTRQRLGLLRDHFAPQSRAIYLSLAALETRRRTPSEDEGPLTRYELRCFSQNGEDGVLAEIFSRIGTESRWFVEFGIQDGREGNCVLLADVEDWNGLFIEANDLYFERLAAKYARTPAVHTTHSMVTPSNLELLMDEAGVPDEPDLLSIDVDGQEYWLWAALSRRRPRVVVVEYNSGLPARERLVMPRSNTAVWDRTDYVGSSLAAFEDLAASRGYRLVHTELTALNAFFVREDLAGGRFPDDDRIPRRTLPNYHLAGVRHVHDPQGRGYESLDASG